MGLHDELAERKKIRMHLHPDEYEASARLREDFNAAFAAVVRRYEKRGADKQEACELAESFVLDLLKTATLDVQPPDLEPESFLGLCRLFFSQKRKFVVGSFAVLSTLIVGAFLTGNEWAEFTRHRQLTQPMSQHPPANTDTDNE